MSDDKGYDDTYSQIKCVDIDIIQNEEWKRMSVLLGQGIDIPDLYEANEAKKNGLIDPRLGPCSHDVCCATCGLDMTYCNGHFGHIDLPETVFHIDMLTFVHKILT